MKYKFFIFGISNGGLFLARQQRKAWPESIIYGFGDPLKDMGRYSSVLNGFYPMTSPENLQKVIQQAYRDIGAGQVKAYICSNSFLEAIVTKASELFDFLEFDNTLEVYRQLVSKTEADRLCNHLNIHRPKGFSLEKDAIDDIIYPVVVKPLEKSLTIGVKKCAFITDKAALTAYLEMLDAKGIQRSHLICQQSVRGNNRWEYGYGGFFEQGRAVIDICFYQLRQVPQGLCCYTMEIADRQLKKQIKELVNPILKTTQYNGFIEFDVKQDEVSKELFLLDINPRPWRSSEMLAAKLKDSTIFNPVINEKIAVWRYPYRELFSWQNRRNVAYAVCRALNQHHSVKTVISLFDGKDIKPFLVQLKNDIKNLMTTIIRKISA